MVNTRGNDHEHYEVDSEMVKKVLMDELKKFFRYEIEKQTRISTDEISNLKEEVQILKDSNIDLINLLTSQNNQKREIMNPLRNGLDTSFLSCSTADTIVEATQTETKTDEKKPFPEVTYKKRQSKKDPSRNNPDKKWYKLQSEQRKETHESIVGTDSSDVEKNYSSGGKPMLWLYVGHCKQQATVDKVKKYLQTKSPGYDFDVMDLNTVRRFKSFEVGANLTSLSLAKTCSCEKVYFVSHS
ncbi:hypothetical protein JTB14_023912 [Gonioctena quinquepunctata]|nr:hypothetical protein JTB14_023912 [Gonioctena quinquepunctata]